MMLPGREILALHRAITAIPSVSGTESALADFLDAKLRRHGAAPERIGNSLLARIGRGPILLLDTHLDTVPPAPGWTCDPWAVEEVDGRIVGLGSNDAKAAVAAMTAAFLAWLDVDLPFTLALALVEGEETKGTGTQAILAELAARGETVEAAVVGEPTGLDLAVAQKGLMVLELRTAGDACHAAHAAALGAANAARRLARDLVALESVDFGPAHPYLGPITLEPTQVKAGTARNVVPAEATAILDVRTTPALSRDEIVARVQAAVQGEVRVLSDRLLPKETSCGTPLVDAARTARPEARLFGSSTLSDMVFLNGTPAVKCGPGQTERSHTPDEYVLASEILDGAQFYTRLIGAYAERRTLTPRPPLPSPTPTTGRGGDEQVLP
ncbi:MAG TPA: M20/M25/M40 family metallo-hydrolase [Thermoanaerobaculia bacterium]|jgi:acetylornithine deacetylase|nr:M20/M25/M40 family metallo-hydrolase [Thermoanaerobaculia bacterium]